ncbi:hypothetical protein [Aneurinibacillus sp. REN35]
MGEKEYKMRGEIGNFTMAASDLRVEKKLTEAFYIWFSTDQEGTAEVAL